VGLPETVAVGESFSFQVSGDLKLVDTTRSVTFDVEVNPVSETRIEGYGSTTVSRADYNLDFPTPPMVANVADEVLLEIDFVAELVEGAEFEDGLEEASASPE
jgi:polyisoprenoid-binding protein YceI